MSWATFSDSLKFCYSICVVIRYYTHLIAVASFFDSLNNKSLHHILSIFPAFLGVDFCLYYLSRGPPS